MDIVQDISEAAKQKGYCSKEKVDSSKLAKAYMEQLNDDFESDKARFKFYRKTYVTFMNFFKGENYTGKTLGKLCLILDVEIVLKSKVN